jgi:16S rRNA processing protein RimM
LKKCDYISLGQIVKPQGNKGEVRVLLHAAEGKKSLEAGKEVYLELRGESCKLEIESVREVPGKEEVILIKFKGVENITQAYKLVGFQIKIKEKDLKPLEKDEFYFFQLKDCSVRDKENKFLGKVVDLLSAGENELLVVKGKKEILIPFVKSICLQVDIEKKEIIVDLPSGLLNLDEI